MTSPESLANERSHAASAKLVSASDALYAKLNESLDATSHDGASTAMTSSTGAHVTYVAMYAFVADGEGQIDLSPNDVLVVSGEGDGEDGGEANGWMSGENKRTGAVGWFPKSHVRLGVSNY